MENNCQTSASYVRRLADFSERLSLRNFVIYYFHADWGCFGCWTITLKREHTAIKLIWDGRDKYLTIESSPFRNFSAPNEWKSDNAMTFPNNDEKSIFAYIEDYLSSKYPN